MRPARGHRAFTAQSHFQNHRHSRFKICTNLLFTLCFLTLAGTLTTYNYYHNYCRCVSNRVFTKKIIFKLFNSIAAVWLYFITQTHSSELLPHSLNSLEILWETTTQGEDICHARLRHAGILLERQQQDKTVATATATAATAAATTSARHKLYTAMNGSLSEGLQLG
jgi:hypothetical protein